MASSCLREHNHVRVGADGPGDGQRAEAQRSLRAAGRGCLHHVVGYNGWPLRGGLHESGAKFRTRSRPRRSDDLVDLRSWTRSRRDHCSYGCAHSSRPCLGTGGKSRNGNAAWSRITIVKSVRNPRLDWSRELPVVAGSVFRRSAKVQCSFGFISGHFVPADVRFTPLLAVFTRGCSTTSRQNLVQLGKGAGEKLGFAKWPASGCVPSTPLLDGPLQGHSHRPRNKVLARADTMDALLKIGR